MFYLHDAAAQSALVRRRLGAILARTQANASKGATVMHVVSSAFNQAGLAFVLAVVILTLL
jgi:hypothetical protein